MIIIKHRWFGYTGLSEKNIFKALGLHHAAAAIATTMLVYMVAWWLFKTPYVSMALAATVVAGWTWHYWRKESRENGPEFEIMDFVSPVIFGIASIPFCNWIVGVYS